jgi:hypothetical protein
MSRGADVFPYLLSGTGGESAERTRHAVAVMQRLFLDAGVDNARYRHRLSDHHQSRPRMIGGPISAVSRIGT